MQSIRKARFMLVFSLTTMHSHKKDHWSWNTMKKQNMLVLLIKRFHCLFAESSNGREIKTFFKTSSIFAVVSINISLIEPAAGIRLCIFQKTFWTLSRFFNDILVYFYAEYSSQLLSVFFSFKKSVQGPYPTLFDHTCIPLTVLTFSGFINAFQTPKMLGASTWLSNTWCVIKNAYIVSVNVSQNYMGVLLQWLSDVISYDGKRYAQKDPKRIPYLWQRSIIAPRFYT